MASSSRLLPSEAASNTPSAAEDRFLPIPIALQEDVDATTWGRLSAFGKNPDSTDEQYGSFVGYFVEYWR